MKFDSEMRIKMEKILKQENLLIDEVKEFAMEYYDILEERKQLIMKINVKNHQP